MSVLIKISVVVLAFSLGLVTVWSQQSTTLNPKALKNRCAYLNEVRANFTACCKYPTVVLWRWMLDKCKDECQKSSQSNSNCCPVVCNYRSFSAIPNANETFRNATWNPVVGLTYAFLLSIGNNTQWTQTLMDSLNFCYGAVEKLPLYDVCGIPLYLYDTIICAYNENFFRCPVWNPDRLAACTYTREYIDLCYRVKT